MSIADWSSNTWVTLFSDLAEQILHKTSQEMGEALEHTPELAEKYLSAITFKTYLFKMRAKIEVYGVSVDNLSESHMKKSSNNVYLSVDTGLCAHQNVCGVDHSNQLQAVQCAFDQQFAATHWCGQN